MKIAIYTRQIKESTTDLINNIINKLLKNNIELFVHTNIKNECKNNINKINFYSNINEICTVNFIICIGGDGTILDTVNYIYNKNIPIIGINFGRLGFLTNIPYNQVNKCLDEILFDNKYFLEERPLLELINNNNINEKYALNEITVQKSNSYNLIVIHTYIDNKFLNSYWADGLIISSPTGSTAYSLSVGGPIIVPKAKNIIITPIAPHNLTVRPIIISDNSEVKLIVETRDNEFLLSIDSKITPINVCRNEIIIKKSNYSIKTVNNINHSFFDTIRNKLMWGHDKRN